MNEVYFFKHGDATFYLTKTDSGKTAIQMLSDGLNLKFYRKYQSWFELKSDKIVRSEISKILNLTFKKLKELKNEKSKQ